MQTHISLSAPLTPQRNSPNKPYDKTRLDRKNSVPQFRGRDIFTSSAKSSYDHPWYVVSDRDYGSVGKFYPDWVLANLQPHEAILDVGAGKGNFINDLFKKKFKKVTGIDKSEESFINVTEIPKKLRDKHLRQIDISELDKKTYANTFNHIFCTYSLFTYEEPQEFQQECLEKMAHWLKPGGKIYLSPVRAYLIEDIAREIPGLKIFDSGLTDNRSTTKRDEPIRDYVVLTKEPTDESIAPESTGLNILHKFVSAGRKMFFA